MLYNQVRDWPLPDAADAADILSLSLRFDPKRKEGAADLWSTGPQLFASNPRGDFGCALAQIMLRVS